MGRAKPERVGKAYRRRATKAGVVSTSSKRRGAGARWRLATDLAPSLDAVALVDHVSDVVIAEHWHSIGDGRLADGSNTQRPLAGYGRAGRDAAEGRRPPVRGFTGRPKYPFRDNILRRPIRTKGVKLNRSIVKRQRFGENGFVVNQTVEATRATTTIEADRRHANFLALEAKRGVQYFFVGGYIAHLLDRALAAWLDVALAGALKKGDRRERRASKAKAR